MKKRASRDGILHRGNLAIDGKDRSVALNGRKASELSPRLFDLLHILASHWPHALTREFLSRSLDSQAKDREVDVMISRLRAHLLKDFGLNLISTVRGVGYKLEAPSAFKMLHRRQQ